MKKLSLVLAVVFIFSIMLPVMTVSASASRGTVLLVYGAVDGKMGAGDAEVQKWFEALNFKVTTMEAPKTTADSPKGYTMVYVSESITSADVGTKFLNSDVAMILGEPGVWDDFQLGTFSQFDAAWTGKFTIANESSPLAAGIKGTYSPFTAGAMPGFMLTWIPGIQIIATTDKKEPTFAVADKGVELLDKTKAAGKRVVFYIRGQDAVTASAETKKLFNAAVEWISPAPVTTTTAAPAATTKAGAPVSAAKTGDPIVFVIIALLSSGVVLTAVRTRKSR